MNTVLFLSPRFPWPLIGGDRVKAYHLLRLLAEKNRVIAVVFTQSADLPDESIQAITRLGVELHVVRLNPLTAGIGCIRSLWTSLPLEIAYYTRDSFSVVVDNILRQEPITDIVSFFMRTSEYVRHTTGPRKILVAEDCRTLYQTRSADATGSLLQRLVRWWEVRKLSGYEASVMTDYDAVTFVSTTDLEAARNLNPKGRYHIVTNGVDLQRFPFQAQQAHRRNIVFVGKLDVEANHIMAMHILTDIMPLVWNREPQVEMHFVGANPKKELLNRIRGTGAKVFANVSDTVPYLHQSAVFLHPHRGGSGIQNKLLEAMATGCPVVTTPSGLQGINAHRGQHCLVGTTPSELAAHTVQLLASVEQRADLARNAYEVIQQDHNWDRIGRQLGQLLTHEPRLTSAVQ